MRKQPVVEFVIRSHVDVFVCDDCGVYSRPWSTRYEIQESAINDYQSDIELQMRTELPETWSLLKMKGVGSPKTVEFRHFCDRCTNLILDLETQQFIK